MQIYIYIVRTVSIMNTDVALDVSNMNENISVFNVKN